MFASDRRHDLRLLHAQLLYWLRCEYWKDWFMYVRILGHGETSYRQESAHVYKSSEPFVPIYLLSGTQLVGSTAPQSELSLYL